MIFQLSFEKNRIKFGPANGTLEMFLVGMVWPKKFSQKTHLKIFFKTHFCLPKRLNVIENSLFTKDFLISFSEHEFLIYYIKGHNSKTINKFLFLISQKDALFKYPQR